MKHLNKNDIKELSNFSDKHYLLEYKLIKIKKVSSIYLYFEQYEIEDKQEINNNIILYNTFCSIHYIKYLQTTKKQEKILISGIYRLVEIDNPINFNNYFKFTKEEGNNDIFFNKFIDKDNIKDEKINDIIKREMKSLFYINHFKTNEDKRNNDINADKITFYYRNILYTHEQILINYMERLNNDEEKITEDEFDKLINYVFINNNAEDTEYYNYIKKQIFVKCANACNKKIMRCYKIKPYFKCGHPCCYRSKMTIQYCIECGNDEENPSYN